MEPFPCYGGAPIREGIKKSIRLIFKGCTNRPFFHISIQERLQTKEEPVIEQIGSYDPLPNKHNEKLVAINFQRLEYWLRKGAYPTEPVQKLLGLCGYFPVHPASFKDAFYRRKEILSELEKLKIEAAKFSSAENTSVSSPTEDLSNGSSSSSSSSDDETCGNEETESSPVPNDGTPKN